MEAQLSPTPNGSALHSLTPVFVHELVDEEGDILFEVMFLGRSIASTYNRRQLDDLLEAVSRPVSWVVPA
jgi:hypothetical protein